jgi:hypothetical protein
MQTHQYAQINFCDSTNDHVWLDWSEDYFQVAISSYNIHDYSQYQRPPADCHFINTRVPSADGSFQPTDYFYGDPFNLTPTGGGGLLPSSTSYFHYKYYHSYFNKNDANGAFMIDNGIGNQRYYYILYAGSLPEPLLPEPGFYLPPQVNPYDAGWTCTYFGVNLPCCESSGQFLDWGASCYFGWITLYSLSGDWFFHATVRDYPTDWLDPSVNGDALLCDATFDTG